MKKLYTILFIPIMVGIIGVFIAKPIQGQTIYNVFYMDNYNNGDHVPNCTSSCDSIKFIPPAGVTVTGWYPYGVQHGDTLVLPTGYGTGTYGQDVVTYYNGTQKKIYIVAIDPPIPPNFSAMNMDTVCGLQTLTLNAQNISALGYTTYDWSNNATTQTTNVGQGNHWVHVSNVCSTVSSDTVTIIEYNPNQPNLGSDITVCKGSSVILNPGTGYSNYLWLPGNSTSSTLSPTTNGTYVVQTTNTIGGCVDNDTIQVTFLVSPKQDIDLVTIDTINGNNRITWTNTYANAVTMNIYRELTTNYYILVGSAPYGNLTWTDTVSSHNQAWRYKIAIIDSCGNEGVKSSYIQSIHTWVTPVVGGGYNVQWTPYEIEAKETVIQYNIYYGSQLSQLNFLTFVSGSVTTYTLSNFVDSVYVIGAQLSNKGATDDALSNHISQQDAMGISDHNLTDLISIYPTITTGPITIKTDLTIQNITIYNSLGQVLLSIEQAGLTTKEKSFDIPYHGVCFVHITTDKGVMNTKIIVQ